MYDLTSHVEQQGSEGDDALTLISIKDTIWFCIADGAGGVSGGADASAFIVSAFTKFAHQDVAGHPDEFESFLRQVDSEINAKPSSGESTAIVGLIKSGVVLGASAGDSEAWLFSSEFQHELTDYQIIKPLLGSGRALPIGFGPMDLEQAMVVGSDGLFKYASLKEISSVVRERGSAIDLAVLAKKQTGYLQDDISVLCIQKMS